MLRSKSKCCGARIYTHKRLLKRFDDGEEHWFTWVTCTKCKQKCEVIEVKEEKKNAK